MAIPSNYYEEPPLESAAMEEPLGLVALARSINQEYDRTKEVRSVNPRGSEKGNLGALFTNLNNISTSLGQARDRQGAGGGGGSELVEGNMDANKLIAFNPYLGENVTSFNRGGMYDVPEYGWGGFFKSIFKPVSKALKTVTKPLNTVLNPIFDAAGNVVDPALSASTNIVRAAGDNIATPVVKTIAKGSRDLVEGTGKVLTKSMQGADNIVNPILKPIMNTAMDLANPVMDVVEDTARPIMKGVGDLVEGGIEGAFDLTKTLGQDVLMPFVQSVMSPGMDLLKALTGHGSRDPYSMPIMQEELKTPRKPMEKLSQEPVMSGLNLRAPDVLSNIKKSSDPAGLVEGDWVGEKENPYVTPNVEEEVDYAAKGMKMPRYNQGGHYTQQANQAIAMNQLSGLIANAMNKRMPQANYGMKMKKRYTNGGRF